MCNNWEVGVNVSLSLTYLFFYLSCYTCTLFLQEIRVVKKKIENGCGGLEGSVTSVSVTIEEAHSSHRRSALFALKKRSFRIEEAHFSPPPKRTFRIEEALFSPRQGALFNDIKGAPLCT